ncbi:hypothetical protein SAMN05660657_05508 [Geodermatophilus amargosae]|uniref:Uncharacterized protein n=1 Tax=Geodermatophilus amargosae TaxID=1296565 RepID=A0A1I7D9L6_9ACTN|nr:hypothetical protein SAMN05660657_05508 [Geodermatophilus amargosae]
MTRYCTSSSVRGQFQYLIRSILAATTVYPAVASPPDRPDALYWRRQLTTVGPAQLLSERFACPAYSLAAGSTIRNWLDVSGRRTLTRAIS